jgi:glycyl-tRNA synthetase (class II)
MAEKAVKIFHELKEHFKSLYDEPVATGRRYHSIDGAGTP